MLQEVGALYPDPAVKPMSLPSEVTTLNMYCIFVVYYCATPEDEISLSCVKQMLGTNAPRIFSSFGKRLEYLPLVVPEEMSLEVSKHALVRCFDFS
jgi:hypothetical protein